MGWSITADEQTTHIKGRLDDVGQNRNLTIKASVTSKGGEGRVSQGSALRPIMALGCGPLAEERKEKKSYEEILRERHENMLKGKGICERTEKESYKEENRRKKWMWRKEYSLRRMAVVHFGWQKKKKFILILTFPPHESKT